MPIRLNLLREAQAAEEERRKDPVKRAILGGVVVVICVLGWSGILQCQVMRSNAEFQNVQGTWQSKEAAYKVVVDSRKTADLADERLAALQRITTNRFLWGSTLNELQHLLAGTKGITVTRLRGDQTFTSQAEFKPKTPKDGVARPATITERIQLTIDARDSSAQLGDQVALLKASLASPQIPGTPAPRYTNQVALLNISAPQSAEKDGKAVGAAFVTFTLQSTYADRVRQ